MKKKLEEAPLYYWEEKSYMMAIPKTADENIIKEGIERLSKNKEIEVKDTNYDIQGYFKSNIIYNKEEYEICFYYGDVHVPEYYLYNNFLFNDEEREALLNAKKAITIFMKFGSKPKKDFQLQLKIATTLIPDLLGLLDESAERLFPAKWVKLCAESKILPSSKDLFNVQAVTGKKDKVWLHTHGLCRCHITELEILDSDKEHYQQHYNLLSTYAMYLIDKEGEYDPQTNSAYIGRLINGEPVVATCRSWTEGLSEYKNLSLGNMKDRKNAHNSKTSIVFLYKNEEDENKGKLSKISIYDNLWKNNPIFFFSNEETNRMSELAKERFNYVKESFKNKDNEILIKIGLPLKEKGKYEHIWFELLEIKENKFKARLTQEPYDIEDIHTGYEDWYEIDDITDWIIYTKEMPVNPNNVYLLEK